MLSLAGCAGEGRQMALEHESISSLKAEHTPAALALRLGEACTPSGGGGMILVIGARLCRGSFRMNSGRLGGRCRRRQVHPPTTA
jgi:hypothetical protein